MKHTARGRGMLTLGLALAVVWVASSMILYPEPSFQAAERGLQVWWNIVLPALLPFFIAAELLMGMGVVRFMGVLFEPVMRPVFGVPGAGSFTMAMGIASGYPLGAALSARLADDGLATKREAERLMCFCNTSDPLFMTGAVAVGMFGRVDIAGIIVISHYVSAIIVGAAMKYWKRGAPETPKPPPDRRSILARAYRAMRDAQEAEKRPFGQLLGDAVTRSVDTLFSILGFMVLFSVIFGSLQILGVTAWISAGIGKVIPESMIPESLHGALVSGIFEITIGTSMASAAAAPLIPRVALTSAIIAWSGLSVHAQVAAVIGPSGLSLLPYSLARLAQSILAATVTVLMMKPKAEMWTLPTFDPYVAAKAPSWLRGLGGAALLCIYSIALIAVLSWVATIIQSRPRRRA